MGITLSRILKKASKPLRRFVRRQIHGRAQDDADRMAAEVGLESAYSTGGAHDAFTHAYVSARLTIVLSRELAERLGDLNELYGSLAVGEVLEARMDQHNNAIGRRIGSRMSREGATSKREIAEHVKAALDAGLLRVIETNVRGQATLVATSRRSPATNRDRLRPDSHGARRSAD